MLHFKRTPFLTIIFLSTFLIFFGRAIELIFWEAPFRTFFWDEALLKPIVEGFFNYNWTDYTKNPNIDLFIQSINHLCGYLLLLASVSVIFIYINKTWRLLQFSISIGVFIIGIVLLLEYKEKFYHTAQFLEGFIQFFTPILLLLFIYKKISYSKLLLFLKLIVGLTFIGHGLYAINLYATPGNFVDMVITLLGVSENSAKTILLTVGWLDILLLILLFIPSVQKPALYYAIIWGMLTAIARFIYYFKLNGYDISSIDALHTMLYRLPHGLIPLAILLLNNYKDKYRNYEIN